MVNNRVTLLFTSDEHGFVTAQSKLQGQVKKAREENPNGTLLVSSGDVFEGSAENGVLGIEASRKMMEAAGYDVMTLGNHDFDHGTEVAKKWVKDASAKVLVSNVKDSHTGELLENTAPSAVFELNGVKVGLIGATTLDTPLTLPGSKLDGLRFEDPVAAVRAEVARLEAQGIQVIGLISHLGLPVDHQMAKAVPQLDFILGGHTHDALQQPDREGQTLIAHPGSFRKSMGRLDLDVNPTTGQVENFEYKLLPGMGDDDGQVGQLAGDYGKAVDEAMGETVAHLEQALPYHPSQIGEAMESLVDESIRTKANADMVLVNQKVIRTALKSGDVTMRDIFNAFPFDNRFVTVSMPAEELLKVCQESVKRLDQTSLTLGERMTVASDITTRETVLVNEVSRGFVGPIKPAISEEIIGKGPMVEVVLPGANIRLATTDYLVSGGLNYFKPGQTTVLEDLGLIRDNVREHMRVAYPAGPGAYLGERLGTLDFGGSKGNGPA